MGRMPEPQDWAAALAHAARDLHQDSLRETLDRATSYAVDLVDGCDAAGIVEVDKCAVRTLAASDATASTGDQLQAKFGAGPCFELLDSTVQAFRIADLGGAPRRWEQFTKAAAEAGIAGVLALPLPVADKMLGVLNVYSLRRDGLTAESERLGALLASHIAVAFAAARAEENLRTAVASHQEIGEAVGILIERHRVSKSEAFAMLSKASQDHNIKLRELARRLVETGEASEILAASKK